MKKKLHVDMDGVLCNFHGAFRNNQSTTNKFPQSKWGFFSTLVQRAESSELALKKAVSDNI